MNKEFRMLRVILRAICVVVLLNPFSVLAQVSVQVQPVEAVLVDLEQRAPAQVLPLNEALIAAEVSAVVKEVFADVGDIVQAGDTLLQLDPTDFQLALQRAEAQLRASLAQKEQADARLRRARELVENQYLSDDDLLARITEVAVIDAQIQANEVEIAIAKINLEKCQIVAPFEGVVTERMAQLGSFVINGTRLMTFTQIDRFELEAEIPANAADTLASADAIIFQSRGDEWPLELLRISPVIAADRRAQTARLAFVNEAPAVGRSGQLVWRLEKGLLPSRLVSRRNQELGVFLHDNGKAVFHALPAAQEGRPVAVDFSPETEIIVLGRDRLQDGDTVSVRN